MDCFFLNLSLLVHLRKSLPKIIENVYVHRSESGQSFRTSGYVEFLEIRPEETFICE